MSRERATMTEPQQTFYDAVGGAATFETLVAVFYDEVSRDEIVRPLYPEEDLGPAERRMRMFLEQYWGGPTTYSLTRGAPRLRQRHMPYKVTPAQRDRWLLHMHAAITEVEFDPEEEFAMRDYVERAAHFMVNADD